MPVHHVYTRAEWAEPLARLDQVESDHVPDVVTTVGEDHDWLEVAVIPDDALVWVIRDGDLVGDAAAAAAGDAVGEADA